MSLTKKGARPIRFNADFYQNFNEDLIPTLLRLFPRIERKGTPPNLLYEVSMTLTPEPGEITQRKHNNQDKKNRPISIDAKLLHKIQTKFNTIFRAYTMTKFLLSYKIVSTYTNQ